MQHMMKGIPNGKKILLTMSNGVKRSFYTEMESYEDVAEFFQSIATNKILFVMYIDNSVEGIYLRDVSSVRVFDAEYDETMSTRIPYPKALAVEELAVPTQAKQPTQSGTKEIFDPNVGGIIVSGL